MAISTTAFAQIPNSGFENWTTMGSYSNPDNWDQLNAMTNPNSVYTCVKGTPGNPGSSYIKLTSKTVGTMGVMHGLAVCSAYRYDYYETIKRLSIYPNACQFKW